MEYEIGIDVSRYQGTIDWNKAVAAMRLLVSRLRYPLHSGRLLC